MSPTGWVLETRYIAVTYFSLVWQISGVALLCFVCFFDSLTDEYSQPYISNSCVNMNSSSFFRKKIEKKVLHKDHDATGATAPHSISMSKFINLSEILTDSVIEMKQKYSLMSNECFNP